MIGVVKYSDPFCSLILDVFMSLDRLYKCNRNLYLANLSVVRTKTFDYINVIIFFHFYLKTAERLEFSS